MKIYDPIYGAFELPSFLTPLLTTPEFRRLSEVRLININSATLSGLAEVRRYSHTLGVLRLALENSLSTFDESEYKALLASIVIHDAATPAFAHLFEYQLIENFDWNHEGAVPALIKNIHHKDSVNHQIYHSLPPKFELACKRGGVDATLVMEIISKKHRASKLIFGSIDFDNLDNVARMNFMLGQLHDREWLYQLARNLEVNEDVGLSLPLSQRIHVERWLAYRRRAYRVLVFDGPTVAGQAVLSRLIGDALADGHLSIDDWSYTDHELLKTLGSLSIKNKIALEKDFHGDMPELSLIAQVADNQSSIFRCGRRKLIQLIEQYLKERGHSRVYGYILRDKGTFEKKISAIDPNSGECWSVGENSDSLIIYGFGIGSRKTDPSRVGLDFLEWYERTSVL